MIAKVAISILSVFLFDQINAQNGIGCVFKDGCPPGQVRINAIVDATGGYLGGCNCGCNPLLGDPSSIHYCDEATHVVNVNGDCSCNLKSTPPVNTPPVNTPPVNTPPVNVNVGPPTYPPIPIYTNPPQTPITVGNFPRPGLPNLSLPPYGNTVNPVNPNAIIPPTPTVFVTPTPINVICDSQGPTPCACPIGHVGECHIQCEGQSLDACKDSLIECNNNGYPCYVTCMMQNSCSGSTSIMGPANGKLVVNCIGDKSCEGSVQFNAETGTDFTANCDGMTSCKGASFNLGKGVSTVACNGDPDACLSSFWNLLPGARTMTGAAFECVGQSCPINVPEPFSNVVGAPLGGCKDQGNCACEPGMNEPCHLACDGTSDSCKDGLIECNSDGFDCIIDCISMNSCAGSTTIIGPSGASLTVNCIGAKSCEGSVTVEAIDTTQTEINCRGNEACKGSGVVINFGNGMNSVSCSGQPDACKDAQFNVPAGALSFSCRGSNCPVEPASFKNGPPQSTQPIQPIQTQPIQQIQPIQPIQAGGRSPYCCRTSIPGFKPWRGRCWDEQSEPSCLAEPNDRCIWDETNCHPNPPVNDLNPNIGCFMRDEHCTAHDNCCSEVCRIDGTCR
eukprot:711348_1